MDAQQVPDGIGRRGMWRLVSTIAGMLGAMVARKLLRTAYRASRKDGDATPFDPFSAQFSWLNTLLWAVAAGIGLSIAKVVSARLAVLGWEVATGTLPPGVVEEPAGAS